MNDSNSTNGFVEQKSSLELIDLVRCFSQEMSHEANYDEWAFPNSPIKVVKMIRYGLSRLEISSMLWVQPNDHPSRTPLRSSSGIGWVEHDEEIRNPENSVFTMMHFIFMAATINEPGNEPLLFSGYLSGELDLELMRLNIEAQSSMDYFYTQNRRDLDMIVSMIHDVDVVARCLAQIALRLYQVQKTLFDPDVFASHLANMVFKHGVIHHDISLYVSLDEEIEEKDYWVQEQLGQPNSTVALYVEFWNRTLGGNGCRFIDALYRSYPEIKDGE